MTFNLNIQFLQLCLSTLCSKLSLAARTVLSLLRWSGVGSSARSLCLPSPTSTPMENCSPSRWLPSRYFPRGPMMPQERFVAFANATASLHLDQRPAESMSSSSSTIPSKQDKNSTSTDSLQALGVSLQQLLSTSASFTLDDKQNAAQSILASCRTDEKGELRPRNEEDSKLCAGNTGSESSNGSVNAVKSTTCKPAKRRRK